MRIDTHRHLGGSIPPRFVWDAIQRTQAYYLAETSKDVHEQMTFGPHEPRNFHRFLNKFEILDRVPWTEELIDESIKQVCADLIADRIDYCWMRFSVNKYVEHINWHRTQAIVFINDCFQRHAPGRVGPILSLKYESSRAGQKQLAALVEHPDVADAVVGLDLVGDEQYFDVDFYRPIFRQWKSAGKMTCAHVAESQPAINCYRAVVDLEVDDIAHGIKAWEYQMFLGAAKERGVGFNLALTSNYLTGVWHETTWHPILKMLEFGVDCTIGTDDPVQCSCTLDDEYRLLAKLGASEEQLKLVVDTAIRRSVKYGMLDSRALEQVSSMQPPQTSHGEGDS